jgi:signal transduction histidine kinase
MPESWDMTDEAKLLRVLLVEDDPIDVRAVRQMFAEVTDVRIDTQHVESLTAAIDRLKEPHEFDAVLLDLGLPESSGLSTLDKFREAVADLPVVVLTAADDLRLAVNAVHHGAQDYLVKGKVTAELIVRPIRYAIERRRMEQERERLLAELQRSNEELERFAYVVAHDLKAPLRAVASFCQFLADDAKGKLDEQATQHIENIKAGTLRMQAVIDDLLEYSRVQRDEKPAESADLAKLLDLVVANLTTEIEHSGAVITHDRLPTLAANASQMVQLFQNLIGNAIKFRRDEPPKIHVAAEPHNAEWRFAVSDNGIGIPAKHHERIFGVFKRLHGENEYPGTGIGLAICKKIVELHGGRIWVESTPGQGTTFFFNIPTRGLSAQQ